MARQDFTILSAGEPSLLREVEEIVIDSHRGLYEKEGRPWSKPIAYRWLRFEDPMPVARLQEGVKELALRQVARGPEDHDRAGVGGLAAPSFQLGPSHDRGAYAQSGDRAKTRPAEAGLALG